MTQLPVGRVAPNASLIRSCTSPADGTVAASASGANLWVATGNECAPTVNTLDGNPTGNSLSMVPLSDSLGRLDAWQAPGSGHDWGYRSSPTLFGGGHRPVLATIPTSSLTFAQPAFAGKRLFVATETNGLLALAP